MLTYTLCTFIFESTHAGVYSIVVDTLYQPEEY